MITDDELAVLIICACSSRNLFIKHHELVAGCALDVKLHLDETLNLETALGWRGGANTSCILLCPKPEPRC